MKGTSKKLTALALAAAMTATMGVMAAAAPSPGYDIYAEDGTLQLLKDGKSCSYSLKDAEIALHTDEDGELIVSFYEEDGTRRLITLGEQNDVEIDGEFSAVTFGKGLSGTANVVFAPGSSVDVIAINASAKFRLEGAAGRVHVNGAAKVNIASGASIVNIVASAQRAHIIAADGADIAGVYAGNMALVSGVHYSSVKEYARGNAAKKPSRPTVGSSDDTTIGSSKN